MAWEGDGSRIETKNTKLVLSRRRRRRQMLIIVPLNGMIPFPRPCREKAHRHRRWRRMDRDGKGQTSPCDLCTYNLHVQHSTDLLAIDSTVPKLHAIVDLDSSLQYALTHSRLRQRVGLLASGAFGEKTIENDRGNIRKRRWCLALVASAARHR